MKRIVADADGSLPLVRTCMRDRIRALVAARISSGEYPPGMRIKEMALAADCNTSQAPVREALRDLEALGLVESERYRGTRVRSADITELREAYELRALLEERAAQLAVPCRPQVLETLRTELTRMREALQRRDHEGHAESAIRFHRAVMAASGNRTLLQTWDSLHWEVRTRIAVARIQQAGVDFGDLVEAHGVIFAALEAGDGVRAGRLLRELIERVLVMLAAPAPAT